MWPSVWPPSEAALTNMRRLAGVLDVIGGGLLVLFPRAALLR